MRWVTHTCSLAIGVGVIAGCANVKVRKVDVDKRIAGKDHHVRGFRYYLNRPYLVVGKHISVGTQLVPVGGDPDRVRATTRRSLCLWGWLPNPTEPMRSMTTTAS